MRMRYFYVKSKSNNCLKDMNISKLNSFDLSWQSSYSDFIWQSSNNLCLYNFLSAYSSRCY
jgi:hypothetical protein